jgi:hypothetical protein
MPWFGEYKIMGSTTKEIVEGLEQAINENCERRLAIELEMSTVRASQGDSKSRKRWEEGARSRYEKLLSEKMLLEVGNGPLKQQLFKAMENLEDTEISDEDLPHAQREKRARNKLFREAKQRLVESLIEKGSEKPDMFLRYLANLLSDLAADFSEGELSKDELLAIRTFKEVMDR